MSHTVAIIPVRGQDVEREGQPLLLGGRPLLDYTIQAAKSCPLIEETVVTTDSRSVQSLAKDLGITASFLRPEALAGTNVPLDDVLQQGLQWFELETKRVYDFVVVLEASHPLRPPDILRDCITTISGGDLDTVFTVAEEHKAFWAVNENGDLERVTEKERETRSSRLPLYREMAGIALVTRSAFIRDRKRLGRKVGVVPVPPPYSLVDTQDPYGLFLAEKFLELI